LAVYFFEGTLVVNAEGYEDCRQRVPAMLAACDGRYLVHGGRTELLEGNSEPNRTVVLEFPAMERLKAFYNSAEYEPLKLLRVSTTRLRIFATDGL
jgi:uncharacterized protein (DUF1330 family)